MDLTYIRTDPYTGNYNFTLDTVAGCYYLIVWGNNGRNITITSGGNLIGECRTGKSDYYAHAAIIEATGTQLNFSTANNQSGPGYWLINFNT